jgi:MFS superfamily sulfate permease-like transporter
MVQQPEQYKENNDRRVISGFPSATWEEIKQIKKHFPSDFMASIVVVLVALPLCLGIAVASGVPPSQGIISGIVGGLVVSLLAGSPLLVSGPAAGLAVIIWELVQKHGIEALGPIVVVAGIIQATAGMFRMGLWFRAVSPSVIHGMLAGIGISIVANQAYIMMDSNPLGHGLKNIMLYPGEVEHLMEGIFSLPFEEWLKPLDGQVHHLALGIGVLTVVVIFLWSKVAPKRLKFVPAPLVAVLLASAVAWVFQFPIKYVSVPANLMDAAHLVSLGDFSEIFHGPIFTVAISIAFIASAETLLSAAAVDKMHSGPRTKYDKELFAQGVGNLLCGLVGALPMTGVIARSATNVSAGAKTRFSALMHALWMLLFAGLLPFTLNLIPIAALAGVLVMVGIKLIDPKHIRQLKQFDKSEVYIYWITLVMIVATNLLDGVIIGIALAFVKLIYSLLHLDVSLDIDREHKSAKLNLQGAATFIQLPKIANMLEKQVPHDGVLHVIIQDLNYIDHACLELFESWAEKYESVGGRLVIEWESLHRKTKRG